MRFELVWLRRRINEVESQRDPLILSLCPRTRLAVSQAAIWQIVDPWKTFMKTVLIPGKRFHRADQLNRHQLSFHSRFPGIKAIFRKTESGADA